MNNEKSIINSWHQNAGAWINVLERKGIASRNAATNEAVIDAVSEQDPEWVLDAGCGEGWLCKQLAEKNIKVSGFDIVPELVAKAAERCEGQFFVAGYDDVAEGKVEWKQKFDVVVINFALLGEESTEKLLKFLPSILKENGSIIIQTLHPFSRKDTGDYITGWKEGSWDGLGEGFTQPYRWYFRTMEDWQNLFTTCGLKITGIKEPVNRDTGKPYSVIFICQL